MSKDLIGSHRMTVFDIRSLPLLSALIFHVANAGFMLGYEKHYEACGLHDPKIVTVAQGTLRGLTMFTRSGRPFCAFRGIPFSQPPVGKYRFESPRDPIPWKGILDATTEAPQCIMVSPPGTSYGVEDCLYLSVFTPRLKPFDGRLLEVMVWINPGEYFAASSDTIIFGPHNIVDRDIVVVYSNFRLGALGFLSTGDDEIPGNYGMKDQVAALRWVKNNIEAFGGNASSITLFGVSSGSASAQYHMLSPLSKGLFHRVISMGGSAINPWSRTADPLLQAKRQARLVGCPTDSTSRLAACFREMDAAKLSNSLMQLMFWIGPTPGYAPVVENKTERNPYPFMSEDPVDVMRSGNFERVPWLMGGSAQDSAFAIVPLMKLLYTRYMVNKFISHNLLSKFLMMGVSCPTDNITNVTKRIADHYLGPGHRLTSENIIQVMNMFSDRWFVHGQYKSVQLMSLVGNQTIYKYFFDYRGLVTGGMAGDLTNYGSAHGDELQYIFAAFYGLVNVPTGDDSEVRDMFLTLLTNFARYGNPTPGIPSGNYLVDEFEWLPVGQTSLDNMHLRYLNIGQVRISGVPSVYLKEGLGPVKLQMSTDLFKERMEFWDSLPLNENCLRNCHRETGENMSNKTTSSGKTKWNVQVTFLISFVPIFFIVNKIVVQEVS